MTQHGLKDARWGRARYGYGGVAALGSRGAKASHRVWAHRLELYYHAFPKGGDVEISVDGGAPTTLSTMADKAQDAWKVIEAPGDKAKEHRFEVQVAGNGPVHLYGLTLERDGPGVVYDRRAGAPDASCIVMTPVDHGEKDRGRVRTKPDLLKMIPVQRRIAERLGCGFFNTFETLGGEGSIGRWYYKVKPRLAWGDFAHLTKSGDRVVGAMIHKALMKGFADFLAR